MKQEPIITKPLASKVLMAGNYYKHHHPGGISAVVQYWEPYFDGLQYYPTYRLTNIAGKAGWFATSYVRMALRMLFDKEVRIVHLHTAADGSFWRKVQLMHLAKCMGRKVVLHVHASRFKDFYNESNRKEWILHNLRLADKLVVLSESWKDWFVGIGVEEKKIVVLHNITDYPQKMAKSAPCDRPIRFLFMGEIGERKGVFDILYALATHKVDLIGKMELRIGGNKNEAKLKQMIQDNQLDDMVRFEGFVSGDKKVELLNWADVFILPSHNEGLPISILEAMSYGMPVISTPVGGIPEVVGQFNGFLVTPGDKEEIYNAICHFISQPRTISSMGANSWEIVQAYLPDYVMGHLKLIYEELLQ